MSLVWLILEFILTYGMESIIVYTALLLKKRVIVYCPENQLTQLMSIVRYAWYSFHCKVLSFIPQFIHPFLCIYFCHPSIDPSIDPLIHPLTSIHPSIHPLIHWSIHPSFDPLIHPPIDSFIHPSISIKALVWLWVEFICLIPPSLLFRSLPALVWHRQNWDIAFPVVEIDDSEVDVLKETSSYVAGVTDASVEGR